MILSSVIFIFSLQIDVAITSEVLIQPFDSRITQLLSTPYECSKQNNLRPFSLTRIQKCTQAPSEIQNTRNFASVFSVLNQKELKTFAVLQLLKRIESFEFKVHIISGIDKNVY